MLYVSLALNLLVLIPVCTVLLRRGPAAEATWGVRTPGRDILLAMYLTIAVLSAALLIRPNITAACTLLTMQVVYKLLTSLTVGSVKHPVVASNLAISAVHGVTLWVVFWG